MSTFGQTTLATVGRGVKVCADGRPEAKQGGVTIDWATVAAVAGADVTIDDGLVIKIGEKYLRRGQVVTKITASGKYGPFDPAVVDGREALDRGETFILDQTVKENDRASDHPVAIYGGLLFKDRILATTGAASLAAGPTFATLEAALPRMQYALDA
jgi:hypothetical protein